MGPPRVLMLPGYTQNAAIFRGKLGALRKGIKDSAELVFIDPPHIVDMPTTSSADFDSTASGTSSAPEDTPRTWWYAEKSEDYTQFRKMDETLAYLRQVLETQGPFDGVWGFSQGATCAAILAALVERPELHPIFAAPATAQHPNWPPPPFKFAIIGSGFLPLDPLVRPLFASKIETPSLHVLGRADTIVGEERSLPLANVFINPRIERHDGGHHTPSKGTWRAFFKAYLEAFGDNGGGSAAAAAVPSPDGSLLGEAVVQKL